MENFNSLGLHDVLTKSLAHMKYDIPTPIQAQAIPFALKGRDVMGSAQTGTGKTAAFSIPLVEKLLRDPDAGTALVLTPTRELGKQIMGIMHQLLGPRSAINTAFIIGGEPMQKQYKQLRNNPRLIVGTPGRVNDHLKRGSMKLDNAHFLVLDETDRMLDMGFTVQLDEIFKYMPQERQTLMFSATLPDDIVRMSNRYLNNPERVAVGSTVTPQANINQEVIRVTDATKYQVLLDQLNQRMGSVIIFAKTKRGVDKLMKRLKGEGFKTDAIHGDLRQSKRDRVIKNFRDMRFRILVATDVVARGLDIPHIQHVINYDLPQVAEDYIHRIGRTARAGADGEALCLINPRDGKLWHAIQCLINPDMQHAMPPRGGNRGGKPNRRSRNGGQGFKGKKRRSPANRNDRNERGDTNDRNAQSNTGGGKNGQSRFEKRTAQRKSDGPKKRYQTGDRPAARAAAQGGNKESGGKSYTAKPAAHKSSPNGGKPSHGKKFDAPKSGGAKSSGGYQGKKPAGKPNAHKTASGKNKNFAGGNAKLKRKPKNNKPRHAA